MYEISSVRPWLVLAGGAMMQSASTCAQNSTGNGLPPEVNNPAVQAAASACQADIQKFCADIQPGGGRIVRCLASNRGNVTPACLTGMLKAKAALGR